MRHAFNVSYNLSVLLLLIKYLQKHFYTFKVFAFDFSGNYLVSKLSIIIIKTQCISERKIKY